MSGLIGGSGSTGSSLLRRILNRHSQIFCGPESSLFCKAPLYTDFNGSKSKILKRGFDGLRSNSWHVYRGVDLGLSEFGINQSNLEPWIENSNSLKEFATLFYKDVLDRNHKKIWLEKTPGNAYNFRAFYNCFPNAHLIHIYRNPFDTIASLFNRGFSHFQATCLYLLNTSFALAAEELDSYVELGYEDVVSDAKSALAPLLSMLRVGWEEKMLTGASEKYTDDTSKLKNWNYDETKPIGKKSIGRFNSLKKEDQDIILLACSSISISSTLSESEKLKYTTIRQLCERLNYLDQKPVEEKYFNMLKAQKRKDQFFRMHKTAFYNYFNYPIVLKKKA